MAAWVALLGGALAWAQHLLVGYVGLSLVCTTGLRDLPVLGGHGTRVFLIAVTAVSIGLIVASALVGFRLVRDARASESERFMGTAALVMNPLFLVAAILQAVPPLALGPCD